MSNELFLGIDTGGTGVKYVVADRDGTIRVSGEVPTDPASITASMKRLKGALGMALGPDASLVDVKAIGMACAGIVNARTGYLGRSPNLPGWENSNLAGKISRVFADRPVALANDVNGALYGEFRQGAGRGCTNLVMIALGTGVGGGLIVEGKLIEGVHAGAGEIGHMVLDLDGPPCTCGGRGCLEAWAGSMGMLRRARELAATGAVSPAFATLVGAKDGKPLTTRDLALLAEEGDETAAVIFAETGRRLGQAVGNLVNLLDPDRVIIGGGVAQAGDLILGPCRAMVPGLILAAEAKNVPVVPAELGPLAAAVGAASLAAEMESSG